jgi:hypothetical protein
MAIFSLHSLSFNCKYLAGEFVENGETDYKLMPKQREIAIPHTPVEISPSWHKGFLLPLAASFLGKVESRDKFGNLLNRLQHDILSDPLGNRLHILV